MRQVENLNATNIHYILSNADREKTLINASNIKMTSVLAVRAEVIKHSWMLIYSAIVLN